MPKELELEQKWKLAQRSLKELTGKEPDLQAALFLIGVQELGQGPRSYSKEEKQDLMHIATCRLLSQLGYYTLTGQDAEGWPLWEPTQSLPHLTLAEQEKLLKSCVVEYLVEHELLHF